MTIHSMRIADTFTSNKYITKFNRLPAKLDAESYFLSRSGALGPVTTVTGPGSKQEGIVPSRAAQQPRLTRKDCTEQSDVRHRSPPAFQIPRHGGDEDGKGAVVLEDNLRRTPRGIGVQKTVHRLEPAGDTDTGSELVFNT